MATTRETARDDTKKLQEQKMKQERMREVRLLLEHLASHEEVTIKLIIDCLVDVGSVNLINQRFRRSPLNRPLKAVVGASKPILRVVAYRWFKQNCPALITNWLYFKVSFPETVKVPPPVKTVNPDPKAVSPKQVALVESEVESANLNREIRRLRGQVRLLSGVSIGAIAALSGVLLWINNRPELADSRQIPSSTQTIDLERFKTTP